MQTVGYEGEQLLLGAVVAGAVARVVATGATVVVDRTGRVVVVVVTAVVVVAGIVVDVVVIVVVAGSVVGAAGNSGIRWDVFSAGATTAPKAVPRPSATTPAITATGTCTSRGIARNAAHALASMSMSAFRSSPVGRL